MAIGNTSLVTPLTIVAAALFDGSPWLPQPPHLGIVSDFQTTTADVLWDNGELSNDIPVGSLVEITAADPATISEFAGKVVRRTVGNQSGEFIGVVVLLANATFETQQGADADFAIVKSLGPGTFFWVSAVSDLEVVAGR